MPGITNWSAALADPRFWACYYSLPDDVYGSILGLSERDVRTYSYTLMGCADHPELLKSDEAAELVDGSVVRLPFPDDFTWTIGMGPEGDLHLIDHPTMYPNGQLIAEVSGHEQWPGLRWPEALRIAHCLRGHWTAEFPVEAVLPLLTPVIGLSPHRMRLTRCMTHWQPSGAPWGQSRQDDWSHGSSRSRTGRCSAATPSPGSGIPRQVGPIRCPTALAIVAR